MLRALPATVRMAASRSAAVRSGCLTLAICSHCARDSLPTPVVITAYADKTFTFIMKTPPVSVLIMKALGLTKGSKTPHTDKVGKLSRAQCEQIAKVKQPDLTAADLEAAMRTVAGSARSMGVEVEGL